MKEDFGQKKTKQRKNMLFEDLPDDLIPLIRSYLEIDFKVSKRYYQIFKNPFLKCYLKIANVSKEEDLINIISKYPYLHTLKLTNVKLEKLTINFNGKLDCSYNQLTQLNCPEVTELWCSNNHLTKLNCPKVKKLLCQNNKLTELNCPKVKKLWCRDNKLTELPSSIYRLRWHRAL